MQLLDNVIQEYAWGSHRAIAELLGRPVPSVNPQAELWLGAHPSAPSRIPGGRTLLEVVQTAPERELGSAVVQAFGERLPFLFKVLAAQTPLSLQVHPSLSQAREGFARENALGIPLTAAQRNYKDDNHKPELLCALTPFDALCGFRPSAQTVTLLTGLQTPSLDEAIRVLEATPGADGLKTVFFGWMRLPAEPRKQLLADVLDACARTPEGPFTRSCRWATELGRQYPGDIGAVCSLLLNCLTLQPGQALFLPAGNLHAYLRGVGLEVMASSDNVLRGGLTPKHIDVEELLRVLHFDNAPVQVLEPQRVGGGEVGYETPAREFRLSRLDIQAGPPTRPQRGGPEILLCTRGQVTLRIGDVEQRLTQGMSAYLSASEPSYSLEGDGQVFRAKVGL